MNTILFRVTNILKTVFNFHKHNAKKINGFNKGNCSVKIIFSGREIELLNFYVSRLLYYRKRVGLTARQTLSFLTHPFFAIVIKDKNREE